MLSRRSVRVKVLQLLYSVTRDESLTKTDILKRYKSSIETSYELFFYSLYSLVQVTKISVEDKEKRESKYLPTDIDKAFDARLFNNSTVQNIAENKYFQKIFEDYKFREKTDKDVFRKIYSEFQNQDIYLEYITKSNIGDEDHLAVLLELFRYCRANSTFNELIEDAYVTWEDDKSLVIGSIKKVLKGLTLTKADYVSEFFPDDILVQEFGESLLIRTFEDDQLLLDLISPVLKNWHHERVALLDMIMLKMAITEFLHFETIPVKVTLNEYVEISKTFSTSKSKEFINGVLDSLQKSLTETGKINKSGRGLVE